MSTEIIQKIEEYKKGLKKLSKKIEEYEKAKKYTIDKLENNINVRTTDKYKKKVILEAECDESGIEIRIPDDDPNNDEQKNLQGKISHQNWISCQVK